MEALVGRWFYARWSGGYLDVVRAGPKLYCRESESAPWLRLWPSEDGLWWETPSEFTGFACRVRHDGSRVVLQRRNQDGEWGLDESAASSPLSAARRTYIQTAKALWPLFVAPSREQMKDPVDEVSFSDVVPVGLEVDALLCTLAEAAMGDDTSASPKPPCMPQQLNCDASRCAMDGLQLPLGSVIAV
eukprot:gnl/TRDRNA2_/TRDRNA2_188044_c0_seq1.p1 gnl/TRDRNA2_/TRDRNA2_188044_c0~~gnl/TRDRNA2_/TRDRNA2_188044_c0_seq1.p1  ORF type:complete len:209 (-),score=26.85 gnl/TRDRNA2_/TRDRNA2_188044_c0_seq1:136-699(-)